MKNFYKTDYTVNYSDVDNNYNMRLDYIISRFQDITGVHSEQIGVDGPTLLKKSNAFWILTKFKLNIKGTPKNTEKIELETWPTIVSSVRFNRDYALYQNGEKIISGASEWCILDYDTKTIRRANSVCYPIDMPHREDRSGAENFFKIKENVCEENYKFTYRTCFTDIDSNQHTNNIAYVRMSLNTFSPDEFANLDIDQFQISFISQTFFGDEIKLYRKNIENGYYIEGKCNEKTVFNTILITK